MIIDSDAHVCEPRDIFENRLPKKWESIAPHVKYIPKLEADMWCVGDKPFQIVTSSIMYIGADGGPERREDEFPAWPKRFDEQHPSSYDPTERVKVMDQVGIRAATTYPSLGLTGPDAWRTIPGADLAFQGKVLEAYNDWVLSWNQEQPGRFITLANLPYWDVPLAVKEIERCAEAGHKGLVMSGKPQNHGCPILADRQWDPMWAAAEAAGMSISFHCASGGLDEHYNADRRRAMGDEALQVYVTVAEFLENAINTIDLLMSGVLHRHPTLNFAIVESGVGWVPFLLESIDEHYKRYRPWRSRPEMAEDVLPSEIFHRQVFVNTWYERLTEQVADTRVVDNLMFETDYPHPTCLMEDEVVDAIENRMGILTGENKEKVLWKNAMRCFALTPADLGLDELL